MRKQEVDLTLIEAWIDSLADEEYDNLIAALEQLEEHGPVTRRPFVETLATITNDEAELRAWLRTSSTNRPRWGWRRSAATVRKAG